MIRFPKGFCVLFFVCLLLPVITGCHYRGDAVPLNPDEKVAFDRIAVIPFQQILPDEPTGGVVRCPLCGVNFAAAKSAGTPEKVLERLFTDQIRKTHPKLTLLEGEKVDGIFRRVSASSLKTPLKDVLREVGSELEVQGVVVGHLYRFRERKGVAYTVEQPASVAFDLHLVRVSDGTIVWRTQFDKTQGSLMEDLLQIAAFLRQKGRWVTAAELAEEGMEEALQTFPVLP